MSTLTQSEARDLILSQGNLVFSVIFIKKNGDLRNMTCRLHVEKYKTGAGRVYDPDNHDLIWVFDMQKQAYRSVSLKTLQLVTAAGIEYQIERKSDV